MLRAETAAIAAAAALAGSPAHRSRTSPRRRQSACQIRHAKSGESRPSAWYSARVPNGAELRGQRAGRGSGAGKLMDGRYVGERLRAIRRQKGLSLHDVEARSNQEFKASVLGAYERGERAISVPRLLRLAELYRVPADQLLPRRHARRRHRPHRRGADLRRRASPSTSSGCTSSTTTTPRCIARYAATIQLQRQDFNGQMLTIRHDDLRVLAAVHGPQPRGPR